MTHIRHISRTALWAICKLFLIFYITIPLLSLPLVVIDAFFHPTGQTFAWLAWVLFLGADRRPRPPRLHPARTIAERCPAGAQGPPSAAKGVR